MWCRNIDFCLVLGGDGGWGTVNHTGGDVPHPLAPVGVANRRSCCPIRNSGTHIEELNIATAHIASFESANIEPNEL